MVKRLILTFVLNGAALWLLIYFVPEIQYHGGVAFFAIGGVFMAIVNMVLKPLLRIVALPFIIVTGGVFMIVINGFLIWLLQYFLEVAQFHDVALVVPSKGSYLIAGLVFGILNWVLNAVFRK